MTWWKPIPGFPAYEVSSNGDVRSLARVVPCLNGTRAISGRLRKARLIKRSGHRCVILYRGGRRKFVFVHRLVLAAFVGNPPKGMPITRHLNGNLADNRLKNLTYVAPPRKGSNKRDKLNARKVLEIRCFAKDPRMSNRYLAGLYSVTSGTVDRIVNLRNWKHVS